MAKLLKKFDTKGKQEMDDRSVIPVGEECLCVIKKSSYDKTKDKKGHIANFQVSVVEGDYKGKMVFVGLNLDNPNDTAVEIAEKEMTSLTKACGLRAVQDTEEVHGIEFMAKMGIEPASGTFPEKNKIVKYWAVPKSGKKSKSKDKDKKKKDKKPDVMIGGKKADKKKKDKKKKK